VIWIDDRHLVKRPLGRPHGEVMTWYLRDRARLVKEEEQMRQASSSAELRQVDGKLAWIDELPSSATRRRFKLMIEYPENFPYSPPKAFVLSPEVDGAPHRLADGSLCLFANPWTAAGLKTTARMVWTRAVVWFFAYEVWLVTGEWQAPQH
jgi:hypothetical protein